MPRGGSSLWRVRQGCELGIGTYSRKIVGWSMSHRMEKSLVMNALRMALGRRCPAVHSILVAA